MHTSAEAKAYARELYLRMRYADVSDANLYYGNMRFDVNVSVSQTNELGTRSETKNLNSFRAVEKAVDYEIDRQIELLEKGQKIVQETRGWDDAKQKTLSQRTKENADDYRYMPDPDLPPIVLTDEFVNKISEEMPKLPAAIRLELSKLDISPRVIEDILDNPEVYEKISTAIAAGASDEGVRRLTYDSLENPETLKIRVEDHVKIAEGVVANTLSTTTASQTLFVMIKAPQTNVDELIKKHAQVSDEGEIAKIVEKVLRENPQAAEDVKNGELKAIGFLVGQVMKESKGQANPQLAQDLVKKQLGIK